MGVQNDWGSSPETRILVDTEDEIYVGPVYIKRRIETSTPKDQEVRGPTERSRTAS